MSTISQNPVHPAEERMSTSPVRWYKERILLPKGDSIMVHSLRDVVLFYLVENSVFAFDRHGQKHLTGKSLSDWESVLDHGCFFRANRRCIVQASHVLGYRPGRGGKLQVLFVSDHFPPVVVSQERAPAFKHWVESL
jgi:DNA-binding LytR/AlgR family response regulator